MSVNAWHVNKPAIAVPEDWAGEEVTYQLDRGEFCSHGCGKRMSGGAPCRECEAARMPGRVVATLDLTRRVA